MAAIVGVAALIAAGAFGTSWLLDRFEGGPDDSGGVSVVDRGQGDVGGPFSFAEGQPEPEPLVDVSEITSGGPPPDGIPPIDDPKFASVGEVTWLTEKEPVMVLEIEGDARAYPLQVMTWHEIVNDTVSGVPVTVTFCPLCNTAYGYVRPEVNGEVTTFGTSGSLYHSNLVMYDRASESWWPQALGEAVVGPLTGARLERIPTQIASWEDFRSEFPDGKVLSRDTGFDRRYGENPYPGYDNTDNEPFLFTGEVDGRLAAVERIIGIEEGDEVVAFPYFRLHEAGTGETTAINDKIDGRPVAVFWLGGTVSALDAARFESSRDVGAAAAFDRRVGGRTLTFEAEGDQIRDKQTLSTWSIFGKATAGELEGEQLEPLDHHDSFWFDWAAFHPDTIVWDGD
ncbi:MAG: DUF3179 domain-containing protein [Actinomycetota bacterium]